MSSENFTMTTLDIKEHLSVKEFTSKGLHGWVEQFLGKEVRLNERVWIVYNYETVSFYPEQQIISATLRLK